MQEAMPTWVKVLLMLGSGAFAVLGLLASDERVPGVRNIPTVVLPFIVGPAMFVFLWSLADTIWTYSTWSRDHWSYISIVAACLFVSVALNAFWLGRITTEKSAAARWPDPYAPVSVVGKKFVNERVVLDGHAYKGCTFENVTFVYDGITAVDVSSSTFRGQPRFDTNNQAVSGAWALMYGMGVMKDGVVLELPSGNLVTPATGFKP
jgi:hypothetical protein